MNRETVVKNLRDAVPLGEHPTPHAEFITVRLDTVQAAADATEEEGDAHTDGFFDGEAAAKTANAQQEGDCSTHPDAPHGFNRNASHNSHKYVCDCEGWEPPNV